MQTTVQQTLMRLLAPLVRFLLRHGVSHAEFSNWSKQMFVSEAERHLSAVDTKKPTVSKIAIITGINRKEVKRLQQLPEEQRTSITRNNRAVRVVSGWLQDEEFHDRDGNPASLAYGNAGSGFNLLVKRYSGDVPARAILDELIRVGTAKRNPNDTVELVQRAYVPHQSREDMLGLYGESAADLLDTLDHNLASPAADSRLQLSVVYDNISPDDLREFKRHSRTRATELLKELDRFLAEKDQDNRPFSTSGDDGTRYRTGLGVYLIENQIQTDDHND